MIEKKPIINKLLRVAEEGLNDTGAENGLRLAATIIHTTPSVVGIRKYAEAHWTQVKALTPFVSTGVCSHCKVKSYVNPDFPHSNFCSVCGAFMTGKVEYYNE